MKTISYSLLDSGNFQKLEQVGPFKIIRPSPQAVWLPRAKLVAWEQVDAVFSRFSGGDGKWTYNNSKVKNGCNVSLGGITFQIKPTDFGHLGIFPEQEENWDRIRKIVQSGVSRNRDYAVLNLFAYTGGSTFAAAGGGAKVVHLDASKSAVEWARENAKTAGYEQLPIRWIVDDVKKFVEREKRRRNRYNGIILDPPSFGRGTRGETWSIEEDLTDLLSSLRELLAEDFDFVLLSAHSPGYTPLALKNLLKDIINLADSQFLCNEMVIKQEGDATRGLPSGSFCLFTRTRT